jgi:acetylornithine deacetylase/succinyl-diaminopimelate desuccinylase-like protein
LPHAEWHFGLISFHLEPIAMNVDAAIQYARENRKDALENLKSLLTIPSISTLPEHKSDMKRVAEWIASKLEALGFEEVRILPTAGHPVVYGSWSKAGKEAPTILVYGHYDVQPVDPLDEWKSDPFIPEIRGEALFARGASDMKGQLIAHLKAMQAMLETDGLPINIKYMIEGEEEIGSPNLEAFIGEHRHLLDCDFCLNTDSGILGADIPSIVYALRGLSYFELRLRGPSSDLHSGTFGGTIVNPANILCDLIAGMKDEDGRVTLPGFYDPVRALTPKEREQLARLPQDDAWWLSQSGANALDGEKGYTPTERATARPTLDVNGLYSGFIGEGSKTVLPAYAMAKFSMRLVPDQTPQMVRQSLEKYLAEQIPASIQWELLEHSSCLPAMIDIESEAVQAASMALEKVWGKSPLYEREGGSVPVVGMLKETLQVNSLMLGFGLPDDNLHAPNEKMHLPTFFRGIETHIHFMACIAS